jgi:3-phenylpropionate/trans-cinnamate dioxygenase ferredoxin component
MATFVKVAALASLPERGLVPVEAGGEKIVLVTTGDGAVYALKDRCSHANFPLSDGQVLDGNRVECQYHGAKFDAATGRALALPAIRPVPTYEVRVEGEDVLVSVE